MWPSFYALKLTKFCRCSSISFTLLVSSSMSSYPSVTSRRNSKFGKMPVLLFRPSPWKEMTDSESDIDCRVSESCRGSLGVELPLLWLEPPEPVSLSCRTSALDCRFTFFIGVLLRGEFRGDEERIGVFEGLMSKLRWSDFGVPGVVALGCFLKSSKTLNKQIFFNIQGSKGGSVRWLYVQSYAKCLSALWCCFNSHFHPSFWVQFVVGS